MTMPRWTRQDDFDVAVYAAAKKYAVEPALVKAVIAQESAFTPNAYRPEAPRPSLPPTSDFPSGGDASFGLMQVLSRTARALGFGGSVQGLFDPGINIDLGTRLLADNLRRSTGSVSDSVSAYNGGWRPSLGYGAVLPNGTYGNQAYVNAILNNLTYFREWESGKGGMDGTKPSTFPGEIADQYIGGEPNPADDGANGRSGRGAIEQAPITWRVPRLAVVGGIATWLALWAAFCRGA